MLLPRLTCLGRSIPFTLGAGAVFGTVMATYRYSKGLAGYESAVLDEDEVERREAMKKMRRRPLSETIEQLGEGRGRLPFHGLTELPTDVTRHLRSGI